MNKTLILACTFLACLALLVGVATAQSQHGDPSPAPSVPTSNPEPVTWAALLGGAALAGGLAYRLRKRNR